MVGYALLAQFLERKKASFSSVGGGVVVDENTVNEHRKNSQFS
jgi:hypothetical protein